MGNVAQSMSGYDAGKCEPINAIFNAWEFLCLMLGKTSSPSAK